MRDHNEDAFLARGGEGLWVVADGMGGLDDGQWASRIVAKELGEAPLSGDLERDAATVAEVIRHANYLIFKESTEHQNHIGSTVVSLLVRGPRFAAVWAGDSRLYLRRGGTLSQVTTDHTQVQQLVNAGYLTKHEAAEHPMSHVLARAVGTHAEVESEVVVGDVQAGDLFLLCSDGLPRVLEDEEIAREMELGNPGAMVQRLLDIALERGAPDNVTILAIGCVDPNGAMGAAMSAGCRRSSAARRTTRRRRRRPRRKPVACRPPAPSDRTAERRRRGSHPRRRDRRGAGAGRAWRRRLGAAAEGAASEAPPAVGPMVVVQGGGDPCRRPWLRGSSRRRSAPCRAAGCRSQKVRCPWAVRRQDNNGDQRGRRLALQEVQGALETKKKMAWRRPA